jgi:co-chaperonin GroES (HSP10)
MRTCICGFSETDFKDPLTLGCPTCYETFREEINVILAYHHGSISHKGIIDCGFKRDKKDVSISNLKSQLEQAIINGELNLAYELKSKINDYERHIDMSQKSRVEIRPAPRHFLVSSTKTESQSNKDPNALFIPETEEEINMNSIKGTVVRIGVQKDEFTDLDVQLGDQIVFSQGITVELGGQKYTLVKDENVLAVISLVSEESEVESEVSVV